jgi:hypothetical protein
VLDTCRFQFQCLHLSAERAQFLNYISSICGASSSQLIQIIFGTVRNPTDIINHAKFHTDRLRSFGVAGTRQSYVFSGKYGRPSHCA